MIAFAREDLFHASSHAWGDVDFIDFNSPRNRIAAALAPEGKQAKCSDENKCPGLQGAAKLINLAAEVERFEAVAGYSGTPLVRKLGIRPGERVIAIKAPPHYASLLGELPEGATLTNRFRANAAFVHLFVTERAELENRLRTLRAEIDQAGTVWISWPKKAAKVATDVTEDVIRSVALPRGFVDVKVCALDETWSGLKLMIRREQRRG